MDIDAVLDIAKKSFEKAWTQSEYLYFLENKSSLCVGVEDGNRTLIGFFLGLRSTDEVDIVSVATLPEFRRRGAARKMLSYILRRCHLSKAYLEVNVENTAAQKLYSDMGFTLKGIRKKYYEGKQDANVMQWESF